MPEVSDLCICLLGHCRWMMCASEQQGRQCPCPSLEISQMIQARCHSLLRRLLPTFRYAKLHSKAFLFRRRVEHQCEL